MSRGSSRSRGRQQRTRSRDDGWEGFQGGYMEAKRQKLLDQFEMEKPGQLQKEGSSSKIFAGITIHVNGYTKPSSDELKRLMMLHGGAYEHFLARRRVTHVIATNLPDSKVRELKGLKVIQPDWITESIKAGRLLSYEGYQLYTAKTKLQHGMENFTTARRTTRSSSSESTSNHIDQQNCGFQGNSMSASNSLRNSIDLVGDVEETEPQRGSGWNMPVLQDSRGSLRLNSDLSALQNSDPTSDTNSTAVKDVREISDNIHQQSASAGRSDTMTSPAKAGDPRFLNEFYTNSRLHHLSTWKSEFREYVNQLQRKGDAFPGRNKLLEVVRQREATLGSAADTVVTHGKPKRCVMHIDMDCFFVSVGLRKRPDLKGKPVAVTHSRGKGAKPAPGSDQNPERITRAQQRQAGSRSSDEKKPKSQRSTGDLSFPDQSDSESDEGHDDSDFINHATIATVVKENTDTFHSMAEIASCSYEARKAGVRNGMFMGRARQLCPNLQTIPYDFEGYQEVSKILYDTVASYTHDIEAVSCDETLVDCTDLLSATGATPLEFATLLRKDLQEATGCTASAGLASSILLAKMATRKAKPNGQFYLADDQVLDFIQPQSIRDIPGVGWSMEKKLESMKIATCGDLQKVTLKTLQKEFGNKTGQSLYNYSRGQDDRPIRMEHERKSVSAEVNYGIRFSTESEAVKFIQELAEEVCSRLQAISKKGKCITLKLMVRREDAPRETAKFMGHGKCNNLSKSVTLPMATDDGRIVGKECVGILKQQKAPPEDLRGIGIQVQKLESATIGTKPTLKGNQSILNFAIGGKTSSRQDSAVGNQSLVSNVSSDKPFDTSSAKSKLNSATMNVSENLAATASEGSRVTVVIEDEGEIDTTVPANSFISELARRRNVTAMPPLPQLPSELTVPVTAACKTPIFKQQPAPGTSGSRQGAGEENDYFPSPSQVDPEVLKELPRDIREQIESEMKTHQKRKSRSDSSEVGCSHWQQNRGDNSQSPSTSSKPSNEVVPLPSPSQLDMSCLSALPESIQSELREAYASKDARPAGSSAGLKPLQLEQARSPSKHSPNKRSPGKGRSPQFKVPRGQPAGRGRKRNTSKKSLFKDKPRVMPSRSTQVSAVTEEVEVLIVEPEKVSESRPTEVAEAAVPAPDLPDSVSLCGAVTVAEVRDLIKEWICSTPAPEQEDEEVLLKYLLDLVHDRNLEQVDLILKFMHRNITYMNSTNWLLCLKRIYSQAQGIVKAMYGSRLASIRL